MTNKFLEDAARARKKDKVYVVWKQGVYMQGIVGVFSTKAKANNAKKVAEQAERDDYHDFIMRIYNINDSWDLSGSIEEKLNDK